MAIVDEDQSAYSAKLVKALQAEGGLAVQTTAESDGTGGVLDRAAAEALVKTGTLPVAIILPKGLGKVQLLADVSDPIAPQIAQGLLQKVSFTAKFDAFPGGANAAAFAGLADGSRQRHAAGAGPGRDRFLLRGRRGRDVPACSRVPARAARCSRRKKPARSAA